MSLVDYAKKELERVGWFDSDSDYGGMLGPAVLEIVRAFAEQGHSGFSAGLVTGALDKLLRFEPLTPLTGEDDEWNEVGPGVFQNNRCGRVFKENGKAHDIEGRIFREPSGACFTNRDSRTPVTFPYVPKSEYVDVDASP